MRLKRVRGLLRMQAQWVRHHRRMHRDIIACALGYRIGGGATPRPTEERAVHVAQRSPFGTTPILSLFLFLVHSSAVLSDAAIARPGRPSQKQLRAAARRLQAMLSSLCAGTLTRDPSNSRAQQAGL